MDYCLNFESMSLCVVPFNVSDIGYLFNIVLSVCDVCLPHIINVLLSRVAVQLTAHFTIHFTVELTVLVNNFSQLLDFLSKPFLLFGVF